MAPRELKGRVLVPVGGETCGYVPQQRRGMVLVQGDLGGTTAEEGTVLVQEYLWVPQQRRGMVLVRGDLWVPQQRRVLC